MQSIFFCCNWGIAVFVWKATLNYTYSSFENNNNSFFLSKNVNTAEDNVNRWNILDFPNLIS